MNRLNIDLLGGGKSSVRHLTEITGSSVTVSKPPEQTANLSFYDNCYSFNKYCSEELICICSEE